MTTPIPWPPRIHNRPAPLEYVETLCALHDAQFGLCAICGGVMRHSTNHRPGMGLSDRSTIDHVIPKALNGADELGNFTAVHGRCNTEKADALPTGCQLIFLLAVNARLGVGAVRW